MTIFITLKAGSCNYRLFTFTATVKKYTIEKHNEYLSGNFRRRYNAMKPILQTERLILRELTTDDASFILELLNTPSWLQYIGDRGVRTLKDAQHYLSHGPIKSYKANGFGLWAMEVKEAPGVPIGLCGLIKRDELDNVDIGFAMLPGYEGKGYAHEAATATMRHAWHTLGLKRVVAITALDNVRSMKLLEKTGFRLEKEVQLPGDTEILNLFISDRVC